MYKFEALLKHNGWDDNSDVLPREIRNQISEFRSVTRKLNDNPEDPKALKVRLMEIDNKIMALVDDYFDVVDEETEAQKKAEKELAKRRKAAGLPEDASLKEIEAKEAEIAEAKEKSKQTIEKQAKYVANRAKKLGLPEGATLDDVEKEELRLDVLKRAEKLGLPKNSTLQQVEEAEAEAEEAATAAAELTERAKTAGLPDDATLEDVEAKEAELAGEAAQLAERAKAVGLREDSTLEQVEAKEAEAGITQQGKPQIKEPIQPAAEPQAQANGEGEPGRKLSNEEVLAKMHENKVEMVSEAELKAAGFNTGFFGPLGGTGCTVGHYKLDKAFSDDKYTLTKIA